MAHKEDKRNPVSLKVYEEQADVGKKVIEKGKVRIAKKVENETQDVDYDVKSEDVEVKRVVVNEYVDEMPKVRYEGDTTIIPVMREEAVVVKKILLVEEIRITRKVNTSKKQASVPVRKEKVSIEKTTNE